MAHTKTINYLHQSSHTVSGAGTKLKVGGGEISGAKRQKNVFVSLNFFGSTSTISCFSDRFCDGQYSLVSYFFAGFQPMFFPCPAICKSGGHVPRAVWSRRVCIQS